MEPQPASRLPLDALLAEAGWLRALARSLVSDSSAADDLVQETWLAALKNPPAADRPLRPWLRTVLENFARMRLRGDGARTRREQARAVDDEHAGEQELVERVEEQRFLAREVLRLDEPFRTCLVLRYYEGLSSEQIAVRSGSNENTVRWRMKRALELLRERLDRRHAGDRSAWLSLLAPLSWPPVEATRAAPPASSAAGAGVLVAALATCALVLLSAWWWRRESPAFDAFAAPSAEQHASASAPSESSDERVRAPVSQAASSPAPRAARAFGRIVDGAGVPIPGAHVSAALERDGERLALATSDEQGRFELVLEPARRLRAEPELSISAPGWLERQTHAPLAVLDEVDCGALVLTREARLAGRVVDSRGRPLEGVELALEPLGARWPAEREPPLEEARRLGSLLDASFARVWSDAAGQFRFEGLRAGYARLWASAAGFETRLEGPLALLEGELTDAGALALETLDSSRVVRGVVLAPSGRPAPGAEVEAARSSLRRPFFTAHPGVVRTRSDAAGRFELALEPAGAYELAARSNGALGRAAQFVGSGSELVIALRTSPATHLSWAPAAAPSEPVEFVVKDSIDGRELLRERVDDAAGEATLQIDHVRALDLAVRRGFEFARVESVDPDDLAKPRRLEFASAPQVRIEVSWNGAALEGARVELLEQLDEPVAWRPSGAGAPLMRRDCVELADASATTDAHGSVRLALDAPRRVRVRVDASHGWPTRLSDPVEVTSAAGVELALAAAGAIEGVVRRADGAPLAGVRVFASQGDGRAWEQLSAADGSYRFEELAPGAWQVRASALAGASSIAADAGVERLDRRRAAFDVELRSGDVARFDVLADEAPACALLGRATLDGAALGACVVELTRPGKRVVLARAWLDPTGRFELGCELPGDYELCIASLSRGGPRFELREPLVLRRGRQRFDWNHSSGVLALRVGAPSSGARASLSSVTPAGGSFVFDAPLGADGRVELRAPAGDARLDVDGIEGARLITLRAGRTSELELD